ncbi:PilZ domain-containing protein [Maricaulis sp. CAU 1757]
MSAAPLPHSPDAGEDDIPAVEAELLEGSGRRAHQRVPLRLLGTYRPADGVWTACRLCDVSPGGARLQASSLPQVDEKVVLDIPAFGQLPGRVVRLGDGEFAIRFTGDGNVRAMASHIARKANRDALGESDRRDGPREPVNEVRTARFSDGSESEVRLVNLSIHGACFQSERSLEEGEQVEIGDLTGEVVRVRGDQFAVRFDPPA